MEASLYPFASKAARSPLTYSRPVFSTTHSLASHKTNFGLKSLLG